MKQTKQIYAVHYHDTVYGSSMQPVKATSKIEAKTKFLNKFTKVSEHDITDVELIEETKSLLYITYKQQAI